MKGLMIDRCDTELPAAFTPEADVGAARDGPSRKEGHAESRNIAEHMRCISQDSDTARGEEGGDVVWQNCFP